MADAPEAPVSLAELEALRGRSGVPGEGGVHFELALPSDVAYIEPVVELVRRQCEAYDYPPRLCSLNIPVALSEALANAILRGNREAPDKRVHVRVAVDERVVVLEVGDEGPGFDLERCAHDPTAPTELVSERGRGLFLMRALMDRVERFDDRRNVVRLTLRRP